MERGHRPLCQHTASLGLPCNKQPLNTMEESPMYTFTRTIVARQTALALVLVGLAFLVLLPGMARAPGNGGEFAVGGGKAISFTPDTTFLMFAFSAHDGPQGASGHVARCPDATVATVPPKTQPRHGLPSCRLPNRRLASMPVIRRTGPPTLACS